VGIGGLMDEVGDVIHGIGQHDDVLPVEGGNEGPVQEGDNLVGNAVSLVLQLCNIGQPAADVIPVFDKVFKALGGFDHVPGAILNKIKELLFAGDERNPHRAMASSRVGL
jgi:hypothetical protein